MHSLYTMGSATRPSDTPPGYAGSSNISSVNFEDYVDVYQVSVEKKQSTSSLLGQALNLAIFFRNQRELSEMTYYLTLAGKHFTEWECDNKKTSLDLVLQDKNFEWFYMPFGYGLFLGSILADTKSENLYVAPQSMKDADAHALALILKTKTHVKVLDIANQHITDDGAIALAKVLREHPNITKVYFSGNQIKKTGIEALVECQKELRALRSHDGINLIVGSQRTTFSERPK